MSVYRRKSGRYAVLIDLEPSATGGRRRKSIGTYRTRREAEGAERKALEARDNGHDLSPKTVTVGELLDRFIASRREKEPPCALRTVARYEELARLTIKPHLGSIAVAKLKALHVDAWLQLLRDRGSAKGKALSARSRLQAFAVLRAALRWAVKKGITTHNAAAAADPIDVRPAQSKAIDEDEAQRFFAVADATRWGPFFRLALGTGARRGELLALRWEDICLPEAGAATLTVRHALVELKDKDARIVEKGTKTEGIRTIPIGELAVEALRSQWEMQRRDRQAAQEAYLDSGHVFQGELGGPVAPFRATNAFRLTCSRAEVKARLHDLRHTAASWMLAEGVDFATVSKILGHSKVSTTLGIYAHAMESAKARALASIDNRLARAKTVENVPLAATAGEAFDHRETTASALVPAPNGNRMATAAGLSVLSIGGGATQSLIK
jgi:integrase